MTRQFIKISQTDTAKKLRMRFKKRWERKVDLNFMIEAIKSGKRNKNDVKRISIVKLLEMSNELSLKNSLLEVLAIKTDSYRVIVTDTEVIFSFDAFEKVT